MECDKIWGGRNILQYLQVKSWESRGKALAKYPDVSGHIASLKSSQSEHNHPKTGPDQLSKNQIWTKKILVFWNESEIHNK